MLKRRVLKANKMSHTSKEQLPCSNPHTRACLFFAAPNFTYAWQIVVLSTFKQAVWICKNCLPDWNQINKCLIMAFKRSKITREIIKNLIQKVASKNWNYCKFEQKINYIWDGFLSCAIQYLVLNVKLVLHCDNQLDLFEYMKMYRIGQRWKRKPNDKLCNGPWWIQWNMLTILTRSISFLKWVYQSE